MSRPLAAAAPASADFRLRPGGALAQGGLAAFMKRYDAKVRVFDAWGEPPCPNGATP